MRVELQSNESLRLEAPSVIPPNVSTVPNEIGFLSLLGGFLVAGLSCLPRDPVPHLKLPCCHTATGTNTTVPCTLVPRMSLFIVTVC